MTVKHVLVIGGRGRVGSQIVNDILTHTDANMTVTGRSPLVAQDEQRFTFPRTQYQPLILDDKDALHRAIAPADLVIHCAGPFAYRDTAVLHACIQHHVDYIDVSDDRTFTRNALALRSQAQSANITAILNSGVFPGISNSMARQVVEQMDIPETIHLSYAVSGTGGAGVTVMRTTFLGLQHPVPVWIDQEWQSVTPYTGRTLKDFPAPLGRVGVYWFDLPELLTLPESFPLKTVTAKFGSRPDVYNHLTAMVARLSPPALLRQPKVIEPLSHLSHRMATISDRWTGTGVAMCVDGTGIKDGQPYSCSSTFIHTHTVAAVGAGTGSIVELMLNGTLRKPGVWPVEQILPTSRFEHAMQSRNIAIAHSWT